MSKHTPTPWVVSKTHINHVDKNIMTEDGYAIADTAGFYSSIDDEKEIEANAKHIVHCVNMHDELVEALTALRPIIAYLASTDNGDKDFDKILGEAINPANELVTAVLAKARGES